MDPSSKTRWKPPIRLLACGVFKPAFVNLRIPAAFPHVQATWLPPSLHIRPDRLKHHVEQGVQAAHRAGEQVVCLYGDCFPDIDGFCRQHGAVRVPGVHCYEILLGEERYRRIMGRSAGTYFVEQELIRNFDEYCAGPLELHDPEVRGEMFAHYEYLLYARQSADPDLVAEAKKLASFLGLKLDVQEANYRHLEKRLVKLIGP